LILVNKSDQIKKPGSLCHKVKGIFWGSQKEKNREPRMQGTRNPCTLCLAFLYLNPLIFS
jgi:hypothetical protein